MRLYAVISCISAVCMGSVLNAQQLGLREYLRRLDTAPGLTLEQKIEHLRNLGVTLSQQGLDDLRMAARPATSSWGSRAAKPGSFRGTGIENDDNPWESYALRPPAYGGLNSLDSYTLRPRGLTGYRIENDLDPADTYTIRPHGLGRYRIESDLDPMKSFTVRPRLGGGYRIESDWDPMKTYTVRPWLGGGFRIENDLDPLDSYTVRPRLGGSYRIESDFPRRRR